MKERQSVRLFFILCLPVLLAVFGLSLAGLEPYPALVFPGFEESGDPQGRIIYDKPEFFVWSEGQSAPLDYRELLVEIPESYLSAVLQKRFSKAPTSAPAPVQRTQNGAMPSDQNAVKRFSIQAGAYDYTIKRIPRPLTAHEVHELAAYLNEQLKRMPVPAQLQKNLQNRPQIDSLTVNWTRTEVLGDETEIPLVKGSHFNISLQNTGK